MISSAETGDGKAERIARECVYRIATGQWAEGDRLPSVREGAGRWGVSQVTVVQAYQRLAAMGLVESRPRSGTYVAAGGRVDRLARHRDDLERLHGEVVELIERETGLWPPAVLRYLARSAAARAEADPECAFLECTALQAGDLARQVSERLQVPCRALTTGELGGAVRELGSAATRESRAAGERGGTAGGTRGAGRDDRGIGGLRTLLTTGFHHDEALEAAEGTRARVLIVPLEFTPERIADDLEGADEVAVLALTEENAAGVAGEIVAHFPRFEGRVRSAACTVSGLEQALEQRLGEPDKPRPGRLVLLSTTLWSEAPERWRDCGGVRPYVLCHRIAGSAWPAIADALGLPLGGAA